MLFDITKCHFLIDAIIVFQKQFIPKFLQFGQSVFDSLWMCINFVSSKKKKRAFEWKTILLKTAYQ
jgi:hypothetical protein